MYVCGVLHKQPHMHPVRFLRYSLCRQSTSLLSLKVVVLRCAVPCRAAQVPNLDAAVSTKTSIKQRGILKSLRMLLAGLTDMGRTAVGLPAIYLPLAGAHIEFSVAYMSVMCALCFLNMRWGLGISARQPSNDTCGRPAARTDAAQSIAAVLV